MSSSNSGHHCICQYCDQEKIQYETDAIANTMRDDMEDISWKNVLTEALLEAWRQQLYTDLVIETEDECIQVHKVILATASPYFRALLNANMSEKSSDCLKLDNIKGETLRVVILYIYSGKSLLTEENAAEILALADYFQILDLKRVCCLFIKNHLTPAMSLPVYELALLHRCQDLADFALQMALKNCSSVIKMSSFLNIQLNTLLMIFKQPILCVSSEDELFKALLFWILHEPDNRKVHYSTLLALLHENQLNPVMKAIYREKVEEEGLDSDIEAGSLVSHRNKHVSWRHKKEEELIIVFGGESNGRILGSAECIALGWTSWCCSVPNYAEEVVGVNQAEGQQVIPPMSQPRTYPGVAVKDNIVYIVGGQTCNQFVSSCETYDILANAWSRFPNLPLSLHGGEAIFVQDKLWVVGGRNGEQTKCPNVLLMFDHFKYKWMFKSPMCHGRVHFGVAGFYGSLFVVGGMGLTSARNQTALSECEKYDSELDSWVPVAPLNQRRAYHRVAVVDDFIYAIGGFDGRKWLNSVERYDPLKDRWTFVNPMISTRSSFGVTVSHGRIYCIGGFSGEAVLNSVEKYNPRTDMWHCVQSMRMRRYGLVAATVRLPSEKIPVTS